MREKLLSWGDDFHIKDDQGRDVFFVDGKVLTIRNQLSFQDIEGRELAHIQKKLIALAPTYEIYRGGQLAARVKRNLLPIIRYTFTVDVPGPNDLVAEGDFFNHEYSFERAGRPVAHISKRWISLTHTYGVDIADGEDPVLILASAVVIDQVNHEAHEDD